MEQQTDNPGVLIFPPLLFGAALLVMLALNWFLPLDIQTRPASLWIGFVLIVAGIILVRWGQRTMVAAGTNVNPSLPSTAIVSSGPFRFSRNPLYVALTLIFIGIALALDTWWGVLVAIVVLLILHYGVVLREERYLERKFGEPYRQYRNSVRRYF